MFFFIIQKKVFKWQTLHKQQCQRGMPDVINVLTGEDMENTPFQSRMKFRMHFMNDLFSYLNNKIVLYYMAANC